VATLTDREPPNIDSGEVATSKAGTAGRSPIPITPLALKYQRESTNRLLDYSPGSFTPETWYEVENLLQSWSLMRTRESVAYTFRLLDRILLVEDCPTFDVDLVNRALNNWRVVWWDLGNSESNSRDARKATNTEEEAKREGAHVSELSVERNVQADGNQAVAEFVRELTPHAMYKRALSYLARSDASVNEKSLYLILEAAVSNGNLSETAQLGQAILDTAVGLASSSHNKQHLLPSTDLCNLVMRSRIELTDASVNNIDSGIEVDAGATVQYCEAVLEKMSQLQIPVNRMTYHRLIQAFTLTKSLQGAVSSERLLRKMQAEHAQGGETVEPSYFTYFLVLSAWAGSGSKDAGARGEALFRELKESKSELCAKHIAVFNKVLRCHVNQSTVKGAKRAMELLTAQEHSDQKPNYLSYSTVLSGFSHVGLAREAEALLGRIPAMYLDAALFTKVITALSKDKSPSSITRARAIFDRLKTLGTSNPNVAPNLYTYNALLECYAKSKSQGFVASDASSLFDDILAQGIEPNLMTYSSLLHCWARFGLVNQALDVLQRIPNPDLRVYNIVLSAFIRSDDARAAPWALKILREMPEHGIVPDIYSYNAAISAYSNSHNRTEATKNVRMLLDELKERYRSTGDARYRPTGVTYNAVMNAYARAHRPDAAEQVLTEMFEDFLSNGNQSARPDVTSFNTVLKAIAFAKNKNGISDKAEALFKRMESLASTIPDLTPNVITYTTLILCHGLSGSPRRAEAALRDMEAKYESGALREGPNLKTFQTLRRAWSTSKEPGKESHVQRIQKEIEERFGVHAERRTSGSA
jgi:pentatricopeptide repeat protein